MQPRGRFVGLRDARVGAVQVLVGQGLEEGLVEERADAAAARVGAR